MRKEREEGTNKVFITLLEGGRSEHERKGQDTGPGGEGRDGGDERDDDDTQKVDVGDTSELLKEVLGQEVEERVFGGGDLVGGKAALSIARGVIDEHLGIGRERLLAAQDADSPRHLWFLLLFSFAPSDSCLSQPPREKSV